MRKIAIVGMADFTDKIPDDHEIWVIALYIGHFSKYSRAFECHEYEPENNTTWHMFMDDPWTELFVPEHLGYLYPKAQLIPTEAMAEKYSRSFGSTISYMIVQAVHEGVDEIALYGVDMEKETKYSNQQPSAYYWLGVANGLGIKTRGLVIDETYGRLPPAILPSKSN